MLHNEARNLLVGAYKKTHDAKGIALAYGVSVPSVYRLAEQRPKQEVWICVSVKEDASAYWGRRIWKT